VEVGVRCSYRNGSVCGIKVGSKILVISVGGRVARRVLVGAACLTGVEVLWGIQPYSSQAATSIKIKTVFFFIFSSWRIGVWMRSSIKDSTSFCEALDKKMTKICHPIYAHK
jgi:hypothetical protein